MTVPAAAYFDFDRTVIDGDAGVLFGHELMRIRRRRHRDEGRGTLGWAVRNALFESRIGGLYAKGAALHLGTKLRVVKRSRLVRTAYRSLKGFLYDDLKLLAGDFFDEVLAKRIFPAARQEMMAHRDAGRRVVVVSTGMHVVIDAVRRHLPVDDVIAVHLVTRDGLLTGGVQGPLWGKEKAEAVRSYAHVRHLSLPQSHAYSDHYSDLKFLQLVGHPVAVNPDWRLRAYAKRRKWPIVRWKLDAS